MISPNSAVGNSLDAHAIAIPQSVRKPCLQFLSRNWHGTVTTYSDLAFRRRRFARRTLFCNFSVCLRILLFPMYKISTFFSSALPGPAPKRQGAIGAKSIQLVLISLQLQIFCWQEQIQRSVAGGHGNDVDLAAQHRCANGARLCLALEESAQAWPAKQVPQAVSTGLIGPREQMLQANTYISDASHEQLPELEPVESKLRSMIRPIDVNQQRRHYVNSQYETRNILQSRRRPVQAAWPRCKQSVPVPAGSFPIASSAPLRSLSQTQALIAHSIEETNPNKPDVVPLSSELLSFYNRNELCTSSLDCRIRPSPCFVVSLV